MYFLCFRKRWQQIQALFIKKSKCRWKFFEYGKRMCFNLIPIKMEFMRNSAMAFLSCITCLQTQDKDDFDFEGNMITKWLPPEILELVFLELNINDLCSCSKTCVRWSLVISSLYKDKCKLNTHRDWNLNWSSSKL